MATVSFSGLEWALLGSKMIRNLVVNSLVLTLVGMSAVRAATHVADSSTGIEVDFEGNQVFTADQLRIAMTSTATSNQPRKRPTLAGELEKGLERLREFLSAHGYLEPRIGKPQVEESGVGVIVRVRLEEGPLYRLGEVKVTGDTVFSEEQIIQALDIKQGDPFSGEAVRTWFEKLKHIYASQGYINWTPIPRQVLKAASSESPEGAVDLAIDMEEGSRFLIRRIEFTGNSLAGEQLLRQRLQIREGEIFVPTSLETSLEQINQLNLFEKMRSEDVDLRLDMAGGQLDIIIPIRDRIRP
jgi:outer membrane protein insertion porin family